MAGSGDIAPFVPSADPMQVSFHGALFGLLMVIALGAIFMTVEYRRGMIHWTLMASPRRGRVLAAKTIVIGVVAFVVGLTGTAIAFPIAAQRLQAGAVGTAPRRFPSAAGFMLRAAGGSVLYLVLIALLSIGIATALRDSALAITAVLGLLYIFPVIGHVLLNHAWQNRIERFAPMNAGLAIQLPAVPLGIRRSLLGVHLTVVVKVERGREVIDRGNSRAETSFLW